MFEFLKKKRANRSKYQVDSENLAVPEIHTGEVPDEENDDAQTKTEAHMDTNSSITFDAEDVAVPEIHIRKK